MTTSRPWAIALAVSAAVNVFLIGGVAGMAYMRLTTPPPPAPAPARPIVVAAPPLVAAPPAPVAPSEAPPRSTRRPAVHAPSAPVIARPPTPVAAPPAEAAPQPAPPRPALISAADALSPDRRQAFRKALNEANKRNRPLTQQARADRQAALDALVSPGYDAGEVSRRLASARSLELQARGNVEAALAAFTATLSPQERAQLADGLSRVYAPTPRPMKGPN
jgi:uncharacterized membrane protein